VSQSYAREIQADAWAPDAGAAAKTAKALLQ
jgi:methanogenic corrinoid protein MtbC1